MTYTDTYNSSPLGRPLWNDPMFWGIVGSLGVHVLFWIVAPFLPSEGRPSENDIQRPVELVELTPAEQERLPDFLTDEVTLPEIAPSSSIPQPRNLPLAPTPGRSPVRFSPTLPPFFVPPPPPEMPFTRVPSRQRRIIVEQPTTRPSVAATPSSPSPSSTPSPSPDPSVSPSPGSEALGPVAAEGAGTPSPSPSASPEPRRFNRPGSRPNSSPAAASPRIAAARQAQLEQPELFVLNEEGTTENAYGANGSAWLANIASLPSGTFASLPDADSYPRVEIAAPYPEEACIQGLEGTAIVGVAVNADGSVVTEEGAEPSILRSSGYGFLNERARELAAEYNFEASDKALPYLVTVSFAPDPEVCEPYLEGLENAPADGSPAPQGG